MGLSLLADDILDFSQWKPWACSYSLKRILLRVTRMLRSNRVVSQLKGKDGPRQFDSRPGIFQLFIVKKIIIIQLALENL